MMQGFKKKHVSNNSQIEAMHSKINESMFQTVQAPGIHYTEEEEPQVEDE